LAEKLPACPVCASNLRIHKFSQVYIASITETADRNEADRTLLSEVFQETNDPAHRQALLSLFSPPQEKSAAPRSIHPDFAVFLSALVVFAFLTTSFQDQIGLLWVGLAGLGGLICLYIILRRIILRRMNISRTSGAAISETSARMMHDWSRLYYCAKDHCVFDPSRQDWAGLEDVYHYLGTGWE
jgi:hypothetical protein